MGAALAGAGSAWICRRPDPRRRTALPAEPAQLAASAADLLARNVDVIVTGGTPAALAAQKATADIPIVFSLGGNPVQRGLIASYERPGGNITGFVEAIVFDRKLEILKEAIPGLVRVACPCRVQTRPAIGAAAHRLGLELQDLDALQLQHLVMRQPEHFVQFVETAKRRGSDGLLIPNLPGFGQFLPLAGRLAAANGLPAIGFGIAFVASGGLLSFGPKEGEGQVVVASIVHRVFQGARPGDIPVVRQRALTLGVNLKTAKALGQAIPPSLLARADEVIE